MSSYQQCPFSECQWSTSEEVNEIEHDAMTGGADRLELHLRIMHEARPDPNPYGWEFWKIKLFPRQFSWDDFDEFGQKLAGERDDR